ncbi:MAG: NADH-quinone oxidoreductase subunit M [Muribaculaceae bacterium]|jgi:NADH-quinone oxidoreductase subunit M|nr:NADH-quinone oxidoreductase subunit M [Muribaculaceae bacterium]MBQ5380950.1 NADH-quinone oxidoreductase subunit M [Paraprevotella sp.]MBQ1185437.1 NADH-quinone oxidoreductase subunit M [Muribaculaceae bacterium]MBQ2398684.1 NADH-quinone oxidoreductase subunit M [Muribaculaceae bacterium]MBQ2439795.1 NADH-quinone oxidoreductase subunit M [Muribaculaceae bacterium]
MILENILIYFVIIPLLMLAGLALCRNMNQIRTVMTVLSTILLGLSVYLCVDFLALRAAGNTDPMLYMASWDWYTPLNIKLALGVDGISVLMIMLSAIIVFAGTFASWKIDPLPKNFFLWFALLSMGVFGFFISIDMFTMFMFYEVALIPMYLLIGVWGTGRKEYSAMKLTLMLMGGSAFLMLGLLGIYWHSAPEGAPLTWNILEIAQNGAIDRSWQMYLFPLTFVGFGVLGAMFPFHTWSPDGHACAPTAVSMLHAGVLMKLGGYGCFRISIFLLPEAANELAWVFIILTGISVVYGAFSACVQTDLKYINAYSSVSHCGMVLFAILMLNTTAMTGAILQMLSHGLMTALFFALIGMIYGRTHTRDIREMGGLMKIMPYLGVCYMIAGFASLGLPGLSGFVAEMTIFFGSFQHTDLFHRAFVIAGTSAIVVTAVYILRVVGKILLGPVQDEHHLQLTDATWYERFSTITLIVCIAGIGCFPNWINETIQQSFAPIIRVIEQAAI